MWGVFAQATAEVLILLNLTTYMGTWICLVAATGRALVTQRRADLGGAAVLLVCVLAFYATRALMQWLLTNPGLTLFWVALAAIAGPILGWLGATTRTPGRQGAVAVLDISALLAGEAIYVFTNGDDPARLGLVAFDLVASVAITVRWVQPSSTRLVVLAALPVAALILFVRVGTRTLIRWSARERRPGGHPIGMRRPRSRPATARGWPGRPRFRSPGPARRRGW
jgi:Family of unknown function (DUF6518)